MTGASDNPATIRDVLRVLFRHWLRMVVFAVLVLGGTFAALFWSPRSYESEAKLFVRVGRENLGLDPTATTSGKQISLYETRESEINSLLEILKSRALVEAVVEEITPGKIISDIDPPTIADSGDARAEQEASVWNRVTGWCKGAWDNVASYSTAVLRPDEVSDYERAVTEVNDALEIWSPRKSAVVLIRCRWKSPATAQKIVETFLRLYTERHGKIHRTPGAHEFFVEQESMLKKQLDEAEGQLRDLKNAGGLVSVGGQQHLIEDQIAQVESQLLSVQSSLKETDGKLRLLEEALQKTPERIVLEEVDGHPNVAGDSMKALLYTLQIQEKELAAKYQEGHPQLTAIRQQVADAQKLIANEAPARKQSTSGVNPVRLKLDQDLLLERSLAAAHQAKREILLAQRGEVLTALKQLNDRALLIDQTQRKVDLLSANYRTYAENLELARIDKALEDERISNVTIVQEASFIAKPTSPKRSLILGAGCAIAFLGALALAFAWEHLDRSIKTLEEAEQTLDLPVLATVPRATVPSPIAARAALN